MKEDGDIVEYNKELQMLFFEFYINEKEYLSVDVVEDRTNKKNYLDISIAKYDDYNTDYEQLNCVYVPFEGFIASEYRYLKKHRKIRSALKNYTHALLYVQT